MKLIAWLVLSIFLVFQIYDSSRKGDYQTAGFWFGSALVATYFRKKDIESGDK